MEIIDVGEVAVEDVVDFLFLERNLKSLSRGNSVPAFVLAHQIIVPDFYKSLINNSETIDATTRDFIDFIVFYGSTLSIVEDKNYGYKRIGESYKVNGFSTSNNDSNIFLSSGVSFSNCLSQFVKYETENVNMRHLSNHMTRAAMVLMKKYSINENKIPSILFVNPSNADESFVMTIDINNPIISLYEKILKPLSICFHEIEEFHKSEDKLNLINLNLKNGHNDLINLPIEIQQLEKEYIDEIERMILGREQNEHEEKIIKLLELKSEKYAKIKNLLDSNSFIELLEEYNELVREYGNGFFSDIKVLDVIEAVIEYKNLYYGNYVFKSTGYEKLRKEMNTSRLAKVKNAFNSRFGVEFKLINNKVRNKKYDLSHIVNRAENLLYKINQKKYELNKSNKFISEFDNSLLNVLQIEINSQKEKLAKFGIEMFLGNSSQNIFKIICTVLSVNSNQSRMNNILPRDLFICHASEDKSPYVNELYACLDLNGITCWFDKNEIKWGDSIVSKVNEGLRISKYVLVVLSVNSIKKNWPKAELEASLNTEFSSGATRVLPLLLGNDDEVNEILGYYPILASKLFVRYSNGLDKIVDLIRDRLC